MEIGLIGLPQSGKTTVFEAITHTLKDKSSKNTNIGISRVEDPRIDELVALFDPKKTEYSISKVENCFDRDVRAVTTYYDGNKVTEFNKSVFSNKKPIFEKKKTIHSFFLEGTAIKISLATEEPTPSSKIKKLLSLSKYNSPDFFKPKCLNLFFNIIFSHQVLLIDRGPHIFFGRF